MVVTGVLAHLRQGDQAFVAAISDEVPDLLSTRLRHLGFRPGTAVEVVRRAPFGGPAIYRLCDYEIVLRREHAQHVMVGVPAPVPSTATASASATGRAAHHLSDRAGEPAHHLNRPGTVGPAVAGAAG